MKLRLLALTFIALSVLSCNKKQDRVAAVEDTPYAAPYAVKYNIPDAWKGAEMIKLVIDADDNVFALTSRGVYRDFKDNLFAKDRMYTPLRDKMPVDITIQEGTGFMYYLYPDRYLSNRLSGKILGLLPEKYDAFAVNAKGEVLLTSATAAVKYADNKKVADLDMPVGAIVRIQAAGDDFYCITDQGICRLEGKSWAKVYSANDLTAMAVCDQEIVIGTKNGYLTTDLKGNVKTPLTEKVPIPEITDLQIVAGQPWFASTDGVFTKVGDKFNYFGRQRWVDEIAVKDIAADSKGDIYMLTASGLSKIEFRQETMASKADYLLKHLRKYHMRFGFSEEADIMDPNDPTSLVLTDSDNDGLWSSIYLGSEAFRYAVTGDPQARANAWETFGTFERLISIHDPEWFSSRSFERMGYHTHDDHAWRPAPDPEWEWKGTTSTDEFVGYLFITAVMDEMVAETPEEKARVAKYITTIMDHIIKNNFYFIDVDGQPTLWGRLNPDYVNSFAHTQFDRILNSVLTLASFQEAYALSGEDIYKAQVDKAINEFGYLENIESGIDKIKYTSGFIHKGIHLGEDWNHSDDEMAFLTYWVLDKYALDDNLRAKYRKLIEDHWDIERPEGDALWNLIAYRVCGRIDMDKTISYLREFPADLTRYNVMNSQRKDLEFLPNDLNTNFREQKTKDLLPKFERPVQRHNTNEFNLDLDTGGRSQLAGDEYLLPYWMARYLEVIK